MQMALAEVHSERWRAARDGRKIMNRAIPLPEEALHVERSDTHTPADAKG